MGLIMWCIECQVDVLKVESKGKTIEQNLKVRLTQDSQILLSEDMSTLFG
jgi:predicted RNA-binding protein with PUA domain